MSERNSSSHSRREKSKHRPSVLGISDIHFLFILKWMNRPVLSPPCGAIQKVRETQHFLSFSLHFVSRWCVVLLFKKKKSSRFFVVGYAKKKKTIEVKVWVVSSWATFTGHFYFFFFWSLRERGFERATSWQDRDKQMAIVRTLVQLKLFNASIVKLLKNQEKWENWWGFFLRTASTIALRA